jgi:hypothetical protein
VLAVLPRTNMTFLVTEFGKPFTAPGFGATVWRTLRRGWTPAMLGA